MKIIKLMAAAALAAVHLGAMAQVKVLLAVEPSLRKEGLSVYGSGLETKLSAVVRERVAVSYTEDLSEALRATRTGEIDMFIAPPQVAASAMAHGFELVGSTAPEEQFVLVMHRDAAGVDRLRGARAYLPQQDSIYAYVMRGMLTRHGVSMRELQRVEYQRYPQAGLVAVVLRFSDATIARQTEWEQWSLENPDRAALLKVVDKSTPVPGGYSVVVKRALSPAAKSAAANWFAGASSVSVGLRPVSYHPEAGVYKGLAELGNFTPKALNGAMVVTAAQVHALVANGAVLVDTRSEKEYLAKRVPGAVLVSYHEKSLKDPAYDASRDDFSGLSKLEKSRPTIFACNGPECWKSYKSSRAAVAAGFRQVFWFRGGLPEWEAAGYPLETGAAALAASGSALVAQRQEVPARAATAMR